MASTAAHKPKLLRNDAAAAEVDLEKSSERDPLLQLTPNEKSGGAPSTESSRLPRFSDMMMPFASSKIKNSRKESSNNNNSTKTKSSHKFECCLCIGGICICCFGLVYLGLFIFVCILLAEANTPSVHVHCRDFWNFMLVCLLFPVLLPLAFCFVRPCISISWLHFSGASAAIMAVGSFCTAYHAGSESSCIEALRLSSPPDPLLLYLDYVNGGLFSMIAISAISKQAHIDYHSSSNNMPK